MDMKITQSPATLIRLGQRLEGTLHLSRHHMIFRASGREIWICYPIIAEVTRRPASESMGPAILRVLCRDFMFVCFEFPNDKLGQDVYDTLEALTYFASVDQLYAYYYSPASQEKAINGWTLYDPAKEYNRMGLEFGTDSGWRLSDANSSFGICATYPKQFVVPQNISDSVLGHAARFRSKGRLPVLSYYHPLNRCTITRCSQPLVGLKQNRNLQDEKLISEIFNTTSPPSGVWGAQVDNLVIDLRPNTNAIAQTAMGGGTENMDRYRPARKIYLGIDNLHIIRDSMNKAIDALRHGDISDTPPSTTSLDRSQWLNHIRIILSAASQVVQQVHYKCSHVVAHCSDGWDRTPQITSLAMMHMDSYYRTLEGFMVLVEKEWVSFGHQFATRSGVYGHKAFTELTDDSTQNMFNNVATFISETTRNRQTGPIFHQFLDCVYQIMYVNPDKFEFNERFLRRLVYHTYSGQYGTFLFDSERQRDEANISAHTRSVWDYFLARRAQFTNPDYVEHTEVFLPPERVRWWAGAFGRADNDMNDPNAWRRTTNNTSLGVSAAAAANSSKQPSPSLSASVANVQLPPTDGLSTPVQELSASDSSLKETTMALENVSIAQKDEPAQVAGDENDDDDDDDPAESEDQEDIANIKVQAFTDPLRNPESVRS